MKLPWISRKRHESEILDLQEKLASQKDLYEKWALPQRYNDGVLNTLIIAHKIAQPKPADAGKEQHGITDTAAEVAKILDPQPETKP